MDALKKSLANEATPKGKKPVKPQLVKPTATDPYAARLGKLGSPKARHRCVRGAWMDAGLG